jgi:hypothetical protein
MQTITINSSASGDNISAYIYEDGDTITATVEKITCPNQIILDLNSSNSAIHTGVTPPEDWAAWKYFFDGTTWTVNELWEEPDFS